MPSSDLADCANNDAAILRHNLVAESFFSAFNGVYLGLAIFSAPVVAVMGFNAGYLELTIIVSAFPVGAFLGPLWAFLGRRWGMQKLVTQMAIWANIPLFFIFLIDKSGSGWFTALITMSQLLNSAMRMGQSTLYRMMYPKEQRGRVLGRLTFWSYLTLVPTILLTGWLLDRNPEMYQVLYPLAGLCGMIGCWYYSMLHVPVAVPLPIAQSGIRASIDGVERIITQDRIYLLFQLAFFLSGSAFFMSTHIILLMTRDRFQFGAFELSLWLTLVPQLLLALSSPFWGRILDRFGITHCRLLISLTMTAYLVSYFAGILWGITALIVLGSILQGLSNGGGQLTWALASSHFAPRAEDVPLYNGIHFVLNGIRGLVMPWVGSILYVLSGGPISVLAAAAFTIGSIPIVLRTMALEKRPSMEEETVLRVVGMEPEKSVG